MAWPDLLFWPNRPGLGQRNLAHLIRRDGPGQQFWEIYRRPARQPDGLMIFWPDGPGLGRKMRPDCWAGPGLGSSFLSQAFCWPNPARPDDMPRYTLNHMLAGHATHKAGQVSPQIDPVLAHSSQPPHGWSLALVSVSFSFVMAACCCSWLACHCCTSPHSCGCSLPPLGRVLRTSRVCRRML
jgi:hypothetical protein